jgi:hypothetical protein
LKKSNKKFPPECIIPPTLKLKQGKQKETWIAIEVRKSKVKPYHPWNA